MGTVTRLMNFGAFVAVLPGKEGLVHISQLAPRRVEKVEDVVKVGDEIMVKVMEIDSQGRINLSRKAVLGGGTRRGRVHASSAPRQRRVQPGRGERRRRARRRSWRRWTSPARLTPIRTDTQKTSPRRGLRSFT